MSASHGKTLVITAADYYLGHHTAVCMIEHHCSKFEKIVLTAVHPDRLEHCKHCKKGHVEIMKIDPNDTSSYERAFEGADCIMFFSEPESGRVQAANRAIDAMKKADVKNVIMFSCEAANSTKHRYLAEFKEMEEKLSSTMNNYIIVRSAALQNCFHFNAPYVRKHHAFPLILSEDCKFAPVDLDDELEACAIMMKEGMEKHRGMKYHFTGPEMMTGPMIAHELTKSINSHKEIKYMQMSCSEMKKYLESIKDHMDHHGEEDIAGGHHHHDCLKCEFKGQPTEHQIHTWIEEMEWLEEGNGKMCEDLKKILGRKGHGVDHFFGDHKNEFTSS